MNCPSCSADTPPAAASCPQCGALLLAPLEPGASAETVLADVTRLTIDRVADSVLTGLRAPIRSSTISPGVTVSTMTPPAPFEPDTTGLPPAAGGVRHRRSIHDQSVLTAGRAFGTRYHVIRLLGAGGMGAVYQARSEEHTSELQ